jgi:dihydrodipicolinate synthase/N-acetylneuraminate lyase
MELLGMTGGPVRAPCTEMTAEAKERMRADIQSTGLLDKVRAARTTER